MKKLLIISSLVFSLSAFCSDKKKDNSACCPCITAYTLTVVLCSGAAVTYFYFNPESLDILINECIENGTEIISSGKQLVYNGSIDSLVNAFNSSITRYQELVGDSIFDVAKESFTLCSSFASNCSDVFTNFTPFLESCTELPNSEEAFISLSEFITRNSKCFYPSIDTLSNLANNLAGFCWSFGLNCTGV